MIFKLNSFISFSSRGIKLDGQALSLKKKKRWREKEYKSQTRKNKNILKNAH